MIPGSDRKYARGLISDHTYCETAIEGGRLDVGRLLVDCWSVLQNLLLDQLRLRFAAVINQCARSSLVRRHKKCGVCTLDFFLQFLFQVNPVWLKAVKG